MAQFNKPQPVPVPNYPGHAYRRTVSRRGRPGRIHIAPLGRNADPICGAAHERRLDLPLTRLPAVAICARCRALAEGARPEAVEVAAERAAAAAEWAATFLG